MKLIQIGNYVTKKEVEIKHNKKYAEEWEYRVLAEQIEADLIRRGYKVKILEGAVLILAILNEKTRPLDFHVLVPEDLYHQVNHVAGVLYATVVNKEVLYFEKL